MSIQVIADNTQVDCKMTTFSDGAINIKIDSTQLHDAEDYVCLTVNPDTPVSAYTDIINIASDIIRGYCPNVIYILNLPYFPNARADRTFETGMSCPLLVFVNMLSRMVNDYNISRISTVDPHDWKAIQKCNALLHPKISALTQENALSGSLPREKALKEILSGYNTVLCAPDKGAFAKTHEIGKKFGRGIVTCHKERDVATGWIKRVELSSADVVGKDILITDDICDGGMTFIKTAEALKNAGAKKVYLYVTHGIFSKGLSCFEGVIDGIWCCQHVMNYVTREQLQSFNRI